LILVFHLADWEPVSRQQLMLYQDYQAEFDRLGAALLAISADQTWCHEAFARDAGIRYPLLSDAHPQEAVSRAFGVCSEQQVSSCRALFVIDTQGVIRWSETYPAAINPGVGGILAALESMDAGPRL
jgi:alkyl hydroperoxide reductase subunit AhpC